MSGTLTDEIHTNTQSDAPIAQMARAALVAEAVPVLLEETTTVSLGNKRKMEELQIAKLETELEARQIENKAKEAESSVNAAVFEREMRILRSRRGKKGARPR
jgi:hypothetical protein